MGKKKSTLAEALEGIPEKSIRSNAFVQALYRALDAFFNNRGMGLPEDAHWDIQVRNFSISERLVDQFTYVDNTDSGMLSSGIAPAYNFTIDLVGIPSRLARVQIEPTTLEEKPAKKRKLTLEERIKQKVKENYKGEMSKEE